MVAPSYWCFFAAISITIEMPFYGAW